MLYTTEAAAGDGVTAELAKRHLRDNSRFVMEIKNFMPKLVLDELKEDGLEVRDDALRQAEAAVHEIWQQPPHVEA
jgi:hypothetical protein